MTLRADLRQPRRVRPGRVIADVLLWIGAALGAVCIVLTILAFTLHISLIMFRTGSMDPTIPTGSVAVVHEIPASDVEVGDIVTVERGDNDLPITHRVTSIADGDSSDERVITMKGDANELEDPAPYRVTTVREVLFSVPGLAPLLARAGSPIVVGTLTVIAAAIVGWAFWPREKKDPDES